MSYMVLYTGLDGSAAFGRCEELTEAVSEVERLRNEQSIDGAQIYRLEEVKFEIKPYFRVELPAEASAIEAPAPLTFATPPAVDAPTPEEAPWVSASASSMTEVPSMVIPPPPPPPPAPVAPMAYDVAVARESAPQDDDAVVGSRRGLFGR